MMRTLLRITITLALTDTTVNPHPPEKKRGKGERGEARGLT